PIAPAVVAREALDALGHDMEIMPGDANREGYEMLSAMRRVDQARALSANFAATSRQGRV
ncbi:MAG TPA: hypothetical protein VG012_03675, partial [Acidimicrobiia bacterium]|nr:hypothetical protein [Acidimicrobiia bacterium]